MHAFFYTSRFTILWHALFMCVSWLEMLCLCACGNSRLFPCKNRYITLLACFVFVRVMSWYALSRFATLYMILSMSCLSILCRCACQDLRLVACFCTRQDSWFVTCFCACNVLACAVKIRDSVHVFVHVQMHDSWHDFVHVKIHDSMHALFVCKLCLQMFCFLCTSRFMTLGMLVFCACHV